jgi:hypothetical protein
LTTIRIFGHGDGEPFSFFSRGTLFDAACWDRTRQGCVVSQNWSPHQIIFFPSKL